MKGKRQSRNAKRVNVGSKSGGHPFKQAVLVVTVSLHMCIVTPHACLHSLNDLAAMDTCGLWTSLSRRKSLNPRH